MAATATSTLLKRACAHRRTSGWGASLMDPSQVRVSGAGEPNTTSNPNPSSANPPYLDLSGPLLQRTHSQFAAQLERALNSSFKEPAATLQSRDTAWDLGRLPAASHSVEIEGAWCEGLV